MEYNSDLWNKYTQENEETHQELLSNFIFNASITLSTKRILEAGCNIGNNLTSFDSNFDVNGLDMNEKALQIAKERLPQAKFEQGSLTSIPFEDNSFDLVFTRGVLIHIHPDQMHDAMKELFRVSKKWIMNLEYFGEDNKMIKWSRGDDLLWYRDMEQRWKEFDVEIVSSTHMSKHIDVGNTHLTLVKKINN